MNNFIFKGTMKKLFAIAALALTHTFASASAIDIVMPFPAGGSTTGQMQVIVPELDALGAKVNLQYMANCQAQQSVRGSRPMLWLWANDTECKQPPKVNEDNFVALLVYQPFYLCGKNANLKDYATGSYRLAVNTPHYKDLISGIIAKVNPNIKVVNYANSNQVRTAMKTNEVEMSFTTVGPVMVAEDKATCYAVSTNTPIGNVPTLTNVLGSKNAAIAGGYSAIMAEGLSVAEVTKYRNAFQKVIQGAAYRDFVGNKQKRELPDASVKNQIEFVNNVNRGMGN